MNSGSRVCARGFAPEQFLHVLAYDQDVVPGPLDNVWHENLGLTICELYVQAWPGPSALANFRKSRRCLVQDSVMVSTPHCTLNDARARSRLCKRVVSTSNTSFHTCGDAAVMTFRIEKHAAMGWTWPLPSNFLNHERDRTRNITTCNLCVGPSCWHLSTS